MHSKSIFLATYVSGQENYDGREWVYPQSVPYTEERMLQFASEAGLLATPQAWQHPNDQRWLMITHPD